MLAQPQTTNGNYVDMVPPKDSIVYKMSSKEVSIIMTIYTIHSVLHCVAVHQSKTCIMFVPCKQWGNFI